MKTYINLGCERKGSKKLAKELRRCLRYGKRNSSISLILILILVKMTSKIQKLQLSHP